MSSSSSSSIVKMGGQNTILPKSIESFLSWMLCISCLSISGYHYYTSNYIKPLFYKVKHYYDYYYYYNYYYDYLHNWIPLTTHSKNEMERKTPIERYNELIQMLYYLSSTTNNNNNNTTTTITTTSIKDNDDDITNINDDLLISYIRNNTICRHLTSLVMRPYQKIITNNDNDNSNNDNKRTKIKTYTTMLLYERPDLILIQRIAKLWPRLLELPSPISLSKTTTTSTTTTITTPTTEKCYNISLIIPSYNESVIFIQQQLQILLERCSLPHLIEVIIVNAINDDDVVVKSSIGDDIESWLLLLSSSTKNNEKSSDDDHDHDDDDGNNELKQKQWGSIRVLKFTNGGGRGPCLNYGANAANGHILTFCHLDTKLPTDWDVKVCNVFECTGRPNHERANSCAFSFGIDTSEKGLSNPFSSQSIGYFPPGIKAVETTANIRTKLFSLPYGDQCLSIPRNIFHFLGGFPDQCLMEDYELVALLRKRAVFMTTPPEKLKIIPGEASLCSPRRWQKFGVLYVTFMNSKFVNLYAGGMGPNDLFYRYYGRSPPKRSNELSPWEIEMYSFIQSMSKSQ